MSRITKFLVCCVLLAINSTDADNADSSSSFEPENNLNSNDAHSPEIQRLKGQYKLKGIMNLSNEYSFSILDVSTHQSRWLNLGDRFDDIQLVEFNNELKQLIVLLKGETCALDLTDPEIPTQPFSAEANKSTQYTDFSSQQLRQNSPSRNARFSRRAEELAENSTTRTNNVQTAANNVYYFNGASVSQNASSVTFTEESNAFEPNNSAVKRPQIVKKPRPLKDPHQQF